MPPTKVALALFLRCVYLGVTLAAIVGVAGVAATIPSAVIGIILGLALAILVLTALQAAYRIVVAKLIPGEKLPLELKETLKENTAALGLVLLSATFAAFVTPLIVKDPSVGHFVVALLIPQILLFAVLRRLGLFKQPLIPGWRPRRR